MAIFPGSKTLTFFAREAIQLEAIILSPEMRQNSPTTISDCKIFPGRNPGTREKKGKGREGEER